MNEKLKKLFWGRTLSIATMHGKEQVLWPLLQQKLWVKTVVPDNFNTDTFGTFTREIPREKHQSEAARKKLLSILKRDGLDLWVSSEWSFWPDPSCPFLPSNLEMVLLIDLKNNYEIIWMHRTMNTNMAGKYVYSPQEALDFAQKVGFPEHGIILRKNETHTKSICKNITTTQELEEKAQEMLWKIFVKKIYIETDMRAHKNPTRMKAIQHACQDMISALESFCPSCQTPGFVISDVERWIPCERCGNPTELPKYHISVCTKCEYRLREENKKLGKYAQATYCDYCNP